MVSPRVRTELIATAHLSGEDHARIRDLMGAAFEDFTDHDWSHALGGLHAVVREGDDVVAHGSIVLRRLLVEGRSLRCGYVEAVAVAPERRREGLGDQVMAELEALGPGYDVLALSSSRDAMAFYRARGWRVWRGPSSVLTPYGPDRVEPTPEDDGAIHVYGGPDDHPLDLDAPITCDWRDGDVW